MRLDMQSLRQVILGQADPNIDEFRQYIAQTVVEGLVGEISFSSREKLSSFGHVFTFVYRTVIEYRLGVSSLLSDWVVIQNGMRRCPDEEAT